MEGLEENREPLNKSPLPVASYVVVCVARKKTYYDLKAAVMA